MLCKVHLFCELLRYSRVDTLNKLLHSKDLYSLNHVRESHTTWFILTSYTDGFSHWFRVVSDVKSQDVKCKQINRFNHSHVTQPISLPYGAQNLVPRFSLLSEFGSQSRDALMPLSSNFLKQIADIIFQHDYMNNNHDINKE